MKKFICAMLICCMLLASTVVFTGCETDAAVNFSETENYPLYENNDAPMLGRVHHPLIDIAFMSAENENSEWLIVNHSNLFTDDERIEIIHTQGSTLHWFTEHLKVITFPQDRGTTPRGVIYIFRDGERIRRVEYFEVHIYSEFLRNEFRPSTDEEISEIIKSMRTEDHHEHTRTY